VVEPIRFDGKRINLHSADNAKSGLLEAAREPPTAGEQIDRRWFHSTSTRKPSELFATESIGARIFD
jgi:hypothetical protein